MHKKTILAALMAIVGASLLVSAAFAGPTASKAGGTLRVNHDTSDYQYVDPQKCYDTGCAEALWPTSLNLFQYPETNGAAGKRVYAEAASALAVSKDGSEGIQRQDRDSGVVRARVRARPEPEDGRRGGGSFRR